MMNAIIVDDETDARNLLAKFVRQFCEATEVVADFADPLAALQFLQVNHARIDLIYLDISMPEMDGVTFLKMCGEYSVQVIFVTAHDGFAIQALRLSALDYILKPIDIDLLVAATERARQSQRNGQEHLRANFMTNSAETPGNQRLALNTEKELRFVKVRDLIYLEADGNYTHLHIRDLPSLLMTERLGNYAEILPATMFFRCHRGFLVNLGEIDKYVKGRGGEIVMSNGAIIPIAQRSKTEFLERLAHF